MHCRVTRLVENNGKIKKGAEKMKPRIISNQELADLPTKWENSNLDIHKYVQSCMKAWEVSKEKYIHFKKIGVLCQKYQDKYYGGY